MGFDPISIAAMTGLSALSSVAGDMAQKRQLQYQAQVAQNNARIANMNADYAARIAQQKEQAEAYKVRGLLGQQRAAQAANGLDVNSGSAADVRASTAALGMQSFGNIRDAGARQFYGYKGQATNFSNQANAYKAAEPGFLDMALHAATSAAKTYASMGGFSGGGAGTGLGAGASAGISSAASAVGSAGGSAAGSIAPGWDDPGIDWDKVSSVTWGID